MNVIGKNDYICNKSSKAKPIIFIFELDQDMDTTKLCKKISSQSDSFFKSYQVNGTEKELLTFTILMEFKLIF